LIDTRKESNGRFTKCKLHKPH